jgi:uncharacterized protein YqeY
MLIDQIRADRIVAFKNKENIKKNLLGCLIGDACKIDKEPTDAFVLSIIKKFIDGAKIVIENAKDTDYEFYQANQEIDILETYRPKQLTEDDIRGKIYRLITAGSIEQPNLLNLGDIMKYFKTNFEGQYDGALVSKLAKKMLV